jgi:thiamine biosynthesis lipoprotein
MAALIADAQRLTRLGEQLFDPGIGRLIALWGFQSDELPAACPTPARWLPGERRRPSIARPALDDHYVSSRNGNWRSISAAISRGVALDRAASILKAQGVHDALINIGGNVMALGSKNGQRWRVGIQHPRQPGPLATLELDDGEAIGTSGDYQRYFEVDGRRYCHLLDPRSAPAGDAHAGTERPDHRAGRRERSQTLLRNLVHRRRRLAASGACNAVEHVLRVDAEGRLQVSSAMQRRLVYVGGTPKALEDHAVKRSSMLPSGAESLRMTACRKG